MVPLKNAQLLNKPTILYTGCVMTGGQADEQTDGWIYERSNGRTASQLVSGRILGPCDPPPYKVLVMTKADGWTDGRTDSQPYLCLGEDLGLVTLLKTRPHSSHQLLFMSDHLYNLLVTLHPHRLQDDHNRNILQPKLAFRMTTIATSCNQS